MVSKDVLGRVGDRVDDAILMLLMLQVSISDGKCLPRDRSYVCLQSIVIVKALLF